VPGARPRTPRPGRDGRCQRPAGPPAGRRQAESARREAPAPPPPGRRRQPGPPLPPLPAALPRLLPPPRAPRRAPFLPRWITDLPTSRRRSRPGLADRLVHLHDLLRKRRELLVPGQLSARLLHFPGGKLTAPGAAASNRPGPQIAGTVPGVTGLGAGTVRLAAAPVVLGDAAPPEIPDGSQPLKQAGTPGLQLSQQSTRHPARSQLAGLGPPEAVGETAAISPPEGRMMAQIRMSRGFRRNRRPDVPAVPACGPARSSQLPSFQRQSRSAKPDCLL
jgi:hypothetical protein